MRRVARSLRGGKRSRETRLFSRSVELARGPIILSWSIVKAAIRHRFFREHDRRDREQHERAWNTTGGAERSRDRADNLADGVPSLGQKSENNRLAEPRTRTSHA